MLWGDVLRNGKEFANETTIATAHAGLGIYYAENNAKAKALQHAQFAHDLLLENATSYHNRNLNSCGIMMAKIGEINRAENILKKVAKINEQLMKSDNPEIAKEATHQRGKNSYNLATLVYIPQKRLEEAITELRLIVPKYKSVGAETDLAAAYHRLSEIYEKTAELAKKLTGILNIRDINQALEYEKISLALWKKHSDNPSRIKTAEENILRIKEKSKQLKFQMRQ